jgi:cell division protein FtsN
LAIGENDSNMASNLKVQNADKPARVAEKSMPVVEKASASPATLSLPSVELSKPEKGRTIEVEEAVFNRQEPAEGATTLASVEQEKTKPWLRTAQDDPQTVNIPVTAPLIGNPSDTERLLEQQGTEPAAVEDKPAPEKRSLTEGASQVLEGFVIQVPFTDRGEAQHWAERFLRRGHTVSMTEASGGGSVRLRIGSFARREQAEQELQALRYNGLKGIILNFPQAYRPEVRPSAGRGAEEAVSVVQ